MIEFFITGLSILLEYIFTYILTCKFLDTHYSAKLTRFICVSIPFSIVCTLFETVTEYNNFTWLLQFILALMAIYITFNIAFANTLLIYSLNYILIMAIQLFIAFFLSLLPNELSYNATAICGNIMTLLVAIVIYLTVPIYQLLDFLLQKKRMLAVIVINLFCVFITISAYHRNHVETFYNFLIPILFMLVILIIVNWELIVNQLIMETLKHKLTAYDEYIPVIDELIDHVRSRQHDFDNQLMALKSLPLTCSTYEELSASIHEYNAYIHDQHKDAYILKINMKLLAGLIFQKVRYAEKNNKTINISLKTPRLRTKMPEHELVDILGILLDNVIEAMPENGTSQLILDCINDKLYLETRNVGPVVSPQFINNIYRKGFSTKPSAHKRGYGLHNLLMHLYKNGGEINVENATDPETNENLIVFQIYV